MASSLDLPLHGTSLHIVRRCGPALGDIVLSKFGCVATFDGVDFERDPSFAQQKRPTVAPQKRFAFSLPVGVEVSVWKADLTNFKVDAVVNAANESLHHGGGLALALSEAGGPLIQKQSRDYIYMHGDLPTGQAIVCDAGLLPCKKIIHAVGPSLSKNHSDMSGAKKLLKMAIESILDEVKKHRLQSVAIPAISSGIFNFPLRECANTIVATVHRYYEGSHSQGHLPQEIRLANHDDPTVREMERACLEILVPSTSRGAARISTPAVQMGHVHLTLKKGKIEEQQTDVIVNTTSQNLNLSVGQISKALLQKAGDGMQQEIKQAPLSGNVIVTKAYKLKCKQVFHTFCTEKSTHPQQQTAAQQVLFRSVTECLWMAASNNHKSISFPAIGTGALRFDGKEVARIMSDAVVGFTQNYPKKMDVCFVIYPDDDKIYKAFEDQIGCLQQRASQSDFTHVADMDVAMSSTPAFENRGDHGSRAPTPQIRLDGPSDVSTREAERWLIGLFCKSDGVVNICNNFIQHFGEQEHLQLSYLTKKGVLIEEVFEKGRAGINICGESNEAVVVAGLQVEAMLCTILKDFVTEEEFAMQDAFSGKKVLFERKTVDTSSKEFLDRSSAFNNEGLRVVKVDNVVNLSLSHLFVQKGKQLSCSTPRTMIQRIPAQFCEMVCQIGFHAEYAPPDEPEYGGGIYFAGTVKEAMEVWKEQKQQEEYLYFVEAEVLTGNSTPGKPGLILPPAVGTEPHVLYNSVSGGSDIAVIFSGYQALPKNIITCKRI